MREVVIRLMPWKAQRLLEAAAIGARELRDNDQSGTAADVEAVIEELDALIQSATDTSSKGETEGKWFEIQSAPKGGEQIEVGWLNEMGELEFDPKITKWLFNEWRGHWTPTHWRPIR